MQRTIIIWLIICYIVAPFNNNHIVFTAPNADFYCIDTNPTTTFPVNLTNSCKIGNQSDSPVCTKFNHDRLFHKRTLVNTFDLVCDKAWYPSFAQSMHQFGYAVSGILLGIISDRYGRAFCAKVAIALEIVAGFGQAFSPNIYFYWFTRFLIGIAAYGRFLNGYVLVAEWVGPKIRGKMSAVYEIGWFSGKVFLPWAYYYIPDYVYVQTAVSTLEIFLFLGYIFLVKESPRWQLTNGQYKRAAKTLKTAALQKGKYSEEEIDRRIKKLHEFTQREHDLLKLQNLDKPSVFDIWKDPKLLKTSLILYFSWFSIALTIYGAYLNIGNIGGSLHLNVFLNSFAICASNVLLYIFIRIVERKNLVQWGIMLMFASLSGMFACSFHDSLIPGRILFFNLSAITGWFSYVIIYIFATEFYPTTTRQTALGICSLFARIGSMSAPFIKELTLATHLGVPVALFTVLSIVNALLWFLLPNTTDIELPDTIIQTKKVEEEAEVVRSRRTSRITSLKPEGIQLNKHK